MFRTEKLVIRLNHQESEAVNRLAETERLPASTLARRLLLFEAERASAIPAVASALNAPRLAANAQPEVRP